METRNATTFPCTREHRGITSSGRAIQRSGITSHRPHVYGTSPDQQPTSVRSLFREPSTPLTGIMETKQKYTVDSYLNISGFSELSNWDSVPDDASCVRNGLVANKRKLVDERINNTFLRNDGIRRRYYDLQEKRMALSSIGEDSPGLKSLSKVKKATRFEPKLTMSPRRIYYERKRNEMRKKNDKYRQKYRELQEKRNILVSLAPDTSLPVIYDARNGKSLDAPDRVPSMDDGTLLINRNQFTRRTSLFRRTRQRCVDSAQSVPSKVTCLRLPPRRGLQNTSYNEAFDILNNAGDCNGVLTSTYLTPLGVPSSQITALTSRKNSHVITLRFSYSYSKDGKLYTEF
ncbi:hypothetical protein LSH36_138g02073 [Paralvinella palmiformis]|uniref:Uncharacterized protein n=1 Tax=Paralvinella palmiformis TaxID=53620 RepID=A0AAD9JVP1_9ANNE|nr:hypothetical protein LSH36_138g02073 [Paralvinella palmiformis]